MKWLLAVAGGALVALAAVDAVMTTLAAGNGGGPLTRRLARATWRGLRAAGRGPLAGGLRFGGVVVLLTTVLTWVVLVWTGWTLVFSSSDAAVVSSSTGAPAGVAARVYFTGFVVFTLGVGDFVPGAGLWQVLTAVATFLGLFLVTLSITYLVSVVSAAVERRTLAREISLSGRTGGQFVLAHWTGDRLSEQLPSTLQSLTEHLVKVTQQHFAYPVLHQFHAAQPGTAAPRALAVLDDALLVLSAGLAPQLRPAADTVLRLERALDHYATTIVGGAVDDAPPPLPDLGALRASGIATVPPEQFSQAAARHARRRAQVRRLVEQDAWDWPTDEAG